MKSRGALKISALSTFFYRSACLFTTLAMVAACPSYVLCQTLHWELLTDIVLQKMYPNSCQKITPLKLDFISPKKIQHYNGKKLDAQKIIHGKNSNP